MITVGNLSILSDFWTHFWPKCSTAVSMATAMQMDKRVVDYLVLGPNTQDRKVSAKSVTMRATALCKNLSGYRELLLITGKLVSTEREGQTDRQTDRQRDKHRYLRTSVKMI